MKDRALVEETVDRLKRIVMFRELTDNEEALTRIAGFFMTEQFAAGQVIMAEGSDGDKMYIIRSGLVEVVKRTTQGDAYTVTVLDAKKGAFFGEMALLDKDKRSASVICKTNCDFFVLTRKAFIDLGNSYPWEGLIITRELSRILCRRLRKTNIDMVTLFDALVQEIGDSVNR